MGTNSRARARAITRSTILWRAYQRSEVWKRL